MNENEKDNNQNTKKKINISSIVKLSLTLIILGAAAYFLLPAFTDGTGKASMKKIGAEELVMENYIDPDEYMESMKKEDSDIKGMTRYDKIKQGLDSSDGADSDMDGLTDKEEIEKYGTDPAKASSSGDMYPDGYKVENGMDLEKKYDFDDSTYKFPNNPCKEIILTPSTASDMNACISDYTGTNMFNLNGQNPVKTYSVSFYSNYVSIDLGSIKGLEPDCVTVYVQNFNDTEAKPVKFSTDKDLITLKKKYDYCDTYIIYLVKGKNTTSGLFSSVAGGIQVSSGSLASAKEDCPKGIVIGCPLLSFIKQPLSIQVEDAEDSELVSQVKKGLIATANDIQEDTYTTKDSDDCISTKKRSQIVRLSKFLDKYFQKFEYPGKVTDEKWYHALFIYYTYDSYAETHKVDADSSAHGNTQKIVMASDLGGEDFLPFPNFGTEISPNGVCAGIAHMTSELHNTGTLKETSAKFKVGDNSYSYDITGDKENKTLMDKGLNDYKTATFVKEHKGKSGILDKDLSDGEKQFATMASYYWAKANNYDVYQYAKCRDIDRDDVVGGGYYDGTIIRNIIKELDKGRMVDAHFVLNNGSGHAVNIYGYEKCTTSMLGLCAPGYVFYVYDSNYPGVTGTLTVEIQTLSNGMETLTYSLDIPGASYRAGSGTGYKTSIGYLNCFVAMDSEYHILNDKKAK